MISQDNQVFIAMELVEGGTLRDWLSRSRTWRQTLEVCLQAGRGLVAAHAAQMIHRDFKPENVLCSDDDRVLVTDFGLAEAKIAIVGASAAELELVDAVKGPGGEARALAIYKTRPSSAYLRSLTQFALAQSLWDTGKTRARALRLANAARRQLATAEEPDAKVARTLVNQWLTVNRRPK